MKSNLLSKFLILQKTSSGFTIVELIIAMALTTIVVSVTGFAVVTIADKNKIAKAETERRIEINRAQDFISDEVRTAIKVDDSSSVPEWANDNDKADLSNKPLDWINKLGGGSPSAKLFLQIPLNVNSINAASDEIDIDKHEFSAGNAVMFTGSGIATAGLSPNKVYYVTKEKDPATNGFQVSDSLVNAKAGTALPVNAVSPGSLTANRLLIYYIRDKTTTWLGPKTVNRSAGPCSDDDTVEDSNCPVLVDSIKTDGFTANAIAPQKVKLDLRGVFFDDNSSKSLQVSNNTFARLFKIIGGADKDADQADKDATQKALEDKTNKDNALKTADDAKKKAEETLAAAMEAKKQADDAAKDYNDYKEKTLKQLDDAAKLAVANATTQPTSTAYNNAKIATDQHAEAEYIAAKKADIAQEKAQQAIEAYNNAAEAATNYSTAEKIATKVDPLKAADHTKYETEAAKKAEEYTNTAKSITQYNGSTHTVAAQTADEKAVRYETTAAKYTTAEQAAKAYNDAKTTANQLAQTAGAASQQATVQRTSTAYEAAATANTNYATAELTAANKANAAQSALNEAVKYASGAEATIKYSAATHITSAEVANQKAADLVNTKRFNTANGVLTLTEPSNVQIEFLGGDIVCATGQPAIPTRTTIYASGQTPKSFLSSSSTKVANVLGNKGTTVTVSGKLLPKSQASQNYCDLADTEYNSATPNTKQVLTLRNGDKPPTYTPFGDSTKTIDSYLTKYISNGKVTIRENQVIYLFELYATTTTGAGYDLQDMVVLATVTAK